MDEAVVMPLEVSWRLMFRANDGPAALRCLNSVLAILVAEVTDPPKPYWKTPELWEASLRSPLDSPPAEGVLHLLEVADRLGSGWLVSGPVVANGDDITFEGVFQVGPGRTHIVGLEWASFSVGPLSASRGAKHCSLNSSAGA
jgi:hypothetical protein